ncbi:MAG: Gfo/Idh/MocA family oxidoreductase [Bacteroidetes bacterium]|nr:Gfo/Idh/MocA family oxidoreductase [Bacteroidota bacterium]
MSHLNRRKFLQTTALAGAGVALTTSQTLASPEKKSFKPKAKLRIGVMGSGLRGQSHIDLLLRREDCEVPAIADIDDRMIARTNVLFEKAGAKKPTVYKDGERDYLRMLEKEDLDAVIIATPWRWHTEMAVESMKAGKYVGVEVCGAFSLDECWQLVNTHESTGTHLMFLENVCYRRDVMAVLNMVRQNMFGEMIHLEGGYQHDLREVKFNDGEKPYGGGVEFGPKAFHEAKWRTYHSVYRNGDLYPTHGIGPVAQYVNINYGNRFLQLTSMASKARGLHDYIINHPKGGKDHPNAKVEFKLGDKITTNILTQNGETIILHHDTNLPRPYSIGFRVQGTKGIWMDVNESLYIEGISPAHQWEEAESYLKKYDHPLWKKHEQKAVGAGHGGMDYFLVNAFVESAKQNITPPFDVYDAATWLAITPLSEQSIAMGSMPVAFPDFTRGRWMNRVSDFGKGDIF